MSLTTDVIDRLAELGDTDEEVAATLGIEGIKGIPHEECACPIFNYLSGQGIQVIAVDQETVFVENGQTGLIIDLPDAIADFIAGFDHGDYPELISDPEVES